MGSLHLSTQEDMCSKDTTATFISFHKSLSEPKETPGFSLLRQGTDKTPVFLNINYSTRALKHYRTPSQRKSSKCPFSPTDFQVPCKTPEEKANL